MTIFKQITEVIPSLSKGVKAKYLQNIIDNANTGGWFSGKQQVNSLGDAYLFIAKNATDNDAQLGVLKVAYDELLLTHSRDQIIELLRLGTEGLYASHSVVLTKHIHTVATEAVKCHELVLSRDVVSFFYCFGICPYAWRVGGIVSSEEIPKIIANHQNLINGVAKGGIEDLNILTKVLFGESAIPNFSKYMDHPSDGILEIEYDAYLRGETKHLVNLLSIASVRFSCRNHSKPDRKRDSDKKLKFATKILADVVATKNPLILTELNHVTQFMTEDVLNEVVATQPELFKLSGHGIVPSTAEFAKELLDNERNRILKLRRKLGVFGEFAPCRFEVDEEFSSSFRDIYQYDNPIYNSGAIQLDTDGTYVFDHSYIDQRHSAKCPIITKTYIQLMLNLVTDLGMPLALWMDAEFILASLRNMLVDDNLSRAIVVGVLNIDHEDTMQVSARDKVAVTLLVALNCPISNSAAYSFSNIEEKRKNLISKLRESASHEGEMLSSLIDFMGENENCSFSNSAMVGLASSAPQKMELEFMGGAKNTDTLNRFFARVIGTQQRHWSDFSPMSLACVGVNLPFDALKLSATGTLTPLSKVDSEINQIDLNPIAEDILSYSNHYRWGATIKKMNVLASYFQFSFGEYIHEDLGDCKINGGYIVGNTAYIYMECSWSQMLSSIARYEKENFASMEKIVIMNVDLDYNSVRSCEIPLNNNDNGAERLPPLTIDGLRLIDMIYSSKAF